MPGVAVYCRFETLQPRELLVEYHKIAIANQFNRNWGSRSKMAMQLITGPHIQTLPAFQGSPAWFHNNSSMHQHAITAVQHKRVLGFGFTLNPKQECRVIGCKPECKSALRGPDKSLP
jgi:hypothetical protein